jgi:hypothetical protein
VVSWHRLRRDALTAQTKARQERNCEPTRIGKVQMELSTDGIIYWVNQNFATDNG